jgi:hypothetical protein
MSRTSLTVIACLSLCLLSPPLARASTLLRRGDADANALLDLTDGVRILDYLFLGAQPLPCEDAGDADDSGTLDLSDAVYIFLHLFLGGPPPASPFGDCGSDTSADSLGCERFPPCPGEYEELVRSFGLLDTLAGKGASENDNGWRLEFEGKPAVEAELSEPHMALGDDAGNTYIADKDAHGIRKVASDGTIRTVAGTSAPGNGADEPGPGVERALDGPNGLWVLADGTVYILDTGNQKVRKLTPAGTMSTLFEISGLQVGRGLWVADDESAAFVASGDKLVRWTSEGGLEVRAAGFGQLGNLFVEPDGSVLVTDRARHQVSRVAPDGMITEVAGNGSTQGGGDGMPALETGLEEVRGVWKHETGGLFLCTHRGSQIWYVDTAGIIHLFIDGARGAHAGDGEPFHTPGKKLSEIRSVTLDRRGNMLITENDIGFVRIVFHDP